LRAGVGTRHDSSVERPKGEQAVKIRGTYALILWGPAFYLSVYACWIAARYTLGHWPSSWEDAVDRIDGPWMATYEVSLVILLFGLPLAYILALASLLHAPRPAQGPGRYRLPELGLAVLLAINLASWLSRIALPRHQLWASNIQNTIRAVSQTGFLIATVISVGYLIMRARRPAPEVPTDYANRLRELAIGFGVSTAVAVLYFVDLIFSPIGAVEWWMD